MSLSLYRLSQTNTSFSGISVGRQDRKSLNDNTAHFPVSKSSVVQILAKQSYLQVEHSDITQPKKQQQHWFRLEWLAWTCMAACFFLPNSHHRKWEKYLQCKASLVFTIANGTSVPFKRFPLPPQFWSQLKIGDYSLPVQMKMGTRTTRWWTPPTIKHNRYSNYEREQWFSFWFILYSFYVKYSYFFI